MLSSRAPQVRLAGSTGHGRVRLGSVEAEVMATLFVAVGGTLGVLARFGIGKLTVHDESLLWSTMGINIIGSFLLGLLVAGTWFDHDVRDGIGVGFLGGFTTFSTFSIQAVLEVDAGEPGRAFAYVTGSVVGGLAAAGLGHALGRSLA